MSLCVYMELNGCRIVHDRNFCRQCNKFLQRNKLFWMMVLVFVIQPHFFKPTAMPSIIVRSEYHNIIAKNQNIQWKKYWARQQKHSRLHLQWPTCLLLSIRAHLIQDSTIFQLHHHLRNKSYKLWGHIYICQASGSKVLGNSEWIDKMHTLPVLVYLCSFSIISLGLEIT